MLLGYLKSCKALVHQEKYNENIVNRFNACIVNKDTEVGVVTALVVYQAY